MLFKDKLDVPSCGKKFPHEYLSVFHFKLDLMMRWIIGVPAVSAIGSCVCAKVNVVKNMRWWSLGSLDRIFNIVMMDIRNCHRHVSLRLAWESRRGWRNWIQLNDVNSFNGNGNIMCSTHYHTDSTRENQSQILKLKYWQIIFYFKKIFLRDKERKIYHLLNISNFIILFTVNTGRVATNN